MGYREVPIDEVKLGMYIRLDLSWFKHPFMRSAFRLTHPDELAALRKLGLNTVKCDPARSALQDPDQTLPVRSGASMLETSAEKRDLIQRAPDRSEGAPKREEGEEAKRHRLRFLKDRRKNLAQREKEYSEAFAQVTNIIRGIEANKEEAIESAQDLMDRTVEWLLQDSETMVHLMNLKEKDNIVFFHSLNVAILAMILGKALGFPRDLLSALGMAGLLHDVGKQKIPKRVTLKKGPLTKAEQKFLQLHPEMGVSMLSQFTAVPKSVIAAVHQHHEKCNGKGYPQGLPGADITDYAKIVAIADVYDNMTNQGNLDRLFTPHETLSFMFTRMSEELSKKMTVAFIKCLGVYPPGTLVELSNGSKGMVVTTDQDKRMSPTVIQYDPTVPREEPIIVNLADEASLHIVCSMRPSEAEPEVLAYLQPGRMIGFFVGALGSNRKSA